jgi:hypothetical protein
MSTTQSDVSYRFIPLTQGQYVVVDSADFEWINQRRWCVHNAKGNYYATAGSKHNRVWMHRVISSTPEYMVCDHWNGDTLDNRRCNLRNISSSQNRQNIKVATNNRSGYPGVFKVGNKWRAKLGKRVLGHFADKEEAIKIRKQEAEKTRMFDRELAPNRILRDDSYRILSRIHHEYGLSGKRYIQWSKTHKSWVIKIPINNDRRRMMIKDLEGAVKIRDLILHSYGLPIPD